jgi:hypothetical protein
MNHHDMVCLDAFKRVKDFGTTNTADFAAKTAKKAGLNTVTTTKTQALFAELTDVITGLTGAATGQVGGAARSGTKLKNGQRQQLLETMRRIHKSADAIASAQNKPELMGNFRLTYGDNNTKLAANALAFADAVDPLQDSFVQLGHDADFVQGLKDQVAAFNAADDSKNAGVQARSGATKSIDPLIHQGLTVLKQLDAIMHNLYAGNAEKMGEWITASHIERTNHTLKAPAPVPEPAPAAKTPPAKA